MNIKYTNTMKNVLKKNNIDTIVIYMNKGNTLKNTNKNFQKNYIDSEKIPTMFYKNLNSHKMRSFYTNTFEFLFLTNGLYKSSETPYELHNLYSKLGKKLTDSDKNIFFFLYGNDINKIKCQIMGFLLGYYIDNTYKTINKINNSKNIVVFYHKNKQFEKDILEFIQICQVQNEIRTLVNAPANILNSLTYSAHIRKNISALKNKNIKTKIIDEHELKKQGLNLILAVNAGSKYPAKLVMIEYKNILNSKSHKKIKNTSGPIALIGKGVMFDSGGYNIKFREMSEMKTDMTGSAIVYGVIKLLATFNIPGHFIAYLPLVENMVSSNSTRPSDIVKSYSGQTVEITNTDAEGRLIIADSISYSLNKNPKLIIDIATLTGDVSAVSDNKASIVIGNNQSITQKFIKIGLENNERFIELPLLDDFINETSSNLANIKSLTKYIGAGTIMAAAFISNFIPDKLNWLHLDIASVSYLSNNSELLHSGATGESLQSLFYYLKKT